MTTFAEIKAREKAQGDAKRAERHRLRKWEAEMLAAIKAARVPPYPGNGGYTNLSWARGLVVPSVDEWYDDVHDWEKKPVGTFISLLCDHCGTQLVRGSVIGFGDGWHVGCPGCGWSDSLRSRDGWRDIGPPPGWVPKDAAAATGTP